MTSRTTDNRFVYLVVHVTNTLLIMFTCNHGVLPLINPCGKLLDPTNDASTCLWIMIMSVFVDFFQ